MKAKPKKDKVITVNMKEKDLQAIGVFPELWVSIFDAVDCNAYYIFNYQSLEKIDINNSIVIYKFKDRQEVLTFFKENNLSTEKFKHASGREFLDKYNFKILEARKVFYKEYNKVLANIASKHIKNNL